MGGCVSAYEDDPLDRRVEQELREDNRENSSIPKLLLLGVGGSGKSTFFKQLMRIHGGGIGELERHTYQGQIFEQMLSQMKLLVEKCMELSQADCVENVDGKYDDIAPSIDSTNAISSLMRIPNDVEITEQVGYVLKKLWSDRGIRNGFEHRAKLCVYDSCNYFWDSIDRIMQPGYIPTDEDCIMCRGATTGMTDRLFTLEGERVRIVDVGGQRSERRKWMHFFDNVTAVLFVASLSAYNEVLYEDERANVMHESLSVFEGTINSAWFGDTPILLFLNKRDLFQEKLKADNSISSCFPEYQGTTDYEESLAFIRDRYKTINKNKQRQLFMHVTTATDKNNVTRVFDDVRHTVIQGALDKILL